MTQEGRWKSSPKLLMKNIKNETQGQSFDVRTFENSAEFLSFLTENPAAADKALKAAEDNFRYHEVNAKVKSLLTKKAEAKAFMKEGKPAEAAAANAAAAKVIVPTDFAEWLLVAPKAPKEDPSKDDVKLATEYWSKVTAKLDKALAEKPGADENEEHEIVHGVLNSAAEAFNEIFHSEAQLPTLAEAFDEEGAPNEHPLDARRLAIAVREDRLAVARDKAAKAAKFDL